MEYRIFGFDKGFLIFRGSGGFIGSLVGGVRGECVVGSFVYNLVNLI